MLLLRSLLAWLVILGLAVGNGAFREAVLIHTLGKAGGLALSGVSLSLFVALVAYALARLQHGFATSQALLIGTLWLCLTLAFEFGFGRYVQHKSWAELVGAYKFKEGNVWPIVPIVTFLAPSMAALFYAKSRKKRQRIRHGYEPPRGCRPKRRASYRRSRAAASLMARRVRATHSGSVPNRTSRLR